MIKGIKFLQHETEQELITMAVGGHVRYMSGCMAQQNTAGEIFTLRNNSQADAIVLLTTSYDPLPSKYAR